MKHVIKDMLFKMVFVYCLMLSTVLIEVAKHGEMAFAHNVLLDGISAQITYVIQLMIYAEHGINNLELVNHVIQDTLSKQENVSLTPPI